eukprot:2001-Eustigmatos_ZCMA.PRE.1
MPKYATEALSALPTMYDLILFNRHWADFKSQLKGQTLITPLHFQQLWRRYLELLNTTDHTGITIPLDGTHLQNRLNAS